MNTFESIYNNDKVDQNISKFADRMNTISSSFGYSYRANSDLSGIKSTIQELKSQLEKDRYVSPSYLANALVSPSSDSSHGFATPVGL